MKHERKPWATPLVRAVLAIVLLLSACSASTDFVGGDEDHWLDGGDAPPVALAIARPDGATVLAIIGDGGELADETLAVAALVDAARPDAVLTAGDNEYTAEGRTVDAYEESVGQVYGSWVERSAFFPVPGDHDYGDDCDPDGAPADLGPYLQYFDLPVGPEDETYYQVRIGDIDVFAVDSVVDCHADGGAKVQRQREWLARQVPASDALMQIVVLHNPPYSSGTSHGSFEELRWDFADWGVDLVVAGDDHIYERATHDGVVYLVNGLGGVAAHELGDPIAGSQVLYADSFGASFLTLDPDTLRATVTFEATTGEQVDAFVMQLPGTPSTAPLADDDAREALPVGATWQWQLQGDLNMTYNVDMYDVDLFDTSAAQIAELHRLGRYVVCYFSAGSFEAWRADSAVFPSSAIGNTLDGWEDERWFDVRNSDVRAGLASRLALATDKGCDGVEPDNVTAANNDTGFAITPEDQLDFNRFLADAAHDRGLTIALKNDLDQIPALVDWFDFAVNEQCLEFDECEAYAPFIAAGKPVFNAEYAARFVSDPSAACASAAQHGLSMIILDIELDDSFRFAC